MSGGSKQSTEFCSGWGRTEDLGTLPAGLRVYRSCPAVHLPLWGLGRRQLLMFPDSENLDLGPSHPSGSKHSLGSSSWRWTLVLSEPVQQFTFLWRGGGGCRGMGGGCGYHMILRVWALGSLTHLSANTHNQEVALEVEYYSSHRLSVFDSVMNLKQWALPLTVGLLITLCCHSAPLLERFYRTVSQLLLLHNHLLLICRLVLPMTLF
jgi:hypothetical protein